MQVVSQNIRLSSLPAPEEIDSVDALLVLLKKGVDLTLSINPQLKEPDLQLLNRLANEYDLATYSQSSVVALEFAGTKGCITFEARLLWDHASGTVCGITTGENFPELVAATYLGLSLSKVSILTDGGYQFQISRDEQGQNIVPGIATTNTPVLVNVWDRNFSTEVRDPWADLAPFEGKILSVCRTPKGKNNPTRVSGIFCGYGDDGSIKIRRPKSDSEVFSINPNKFDILNVKLGAEHVCWSETAGRHALTNALSRVSSGVEIVAQCTHRVAGEFSRSENIVGKLLGVAKSADGKQFLVLESAECKLYDTSGSLIGMPFKRSTVVLDCSKLAGFSTSPYVQAQDFEYPGFVDVADGKTRYEPIEAKVLFKS